MHPKQPSFQDLVARRVIEGLGNRISVRFRNIQSNHNVILGVSGGNGNRKSTNLIHQIFAKLDDGKYSFEKLNSITTTFQI